MRQVWEGLAVRKMVVITVVVLLMLSLLGKGLTARADSLRQASDAPRITSFTTTISVVDRAALAARTARIPVSWTTANRPFIANLFFEQVLEDGSAINVELPRPIPWVASSGNGTAAPILPGQSATQVVLRLRLVNLVTSQVYDERQLTVSIGAGGSSGSNNSRPAIERFTTCCSTVRADQLNARTARVPVSWSVINRPLNTNLVFEQVLADGSVVNVELPRENPWVASSGDGVAAPVPPGGSATTVRLRVRLIDVLNGRVYDVRELILTIGDAPVGNPAFRYFTTPFAGVDGTQLNQRIARVPVSWAVDNRPDNSNLAFEQVLPGGSVVNVELPRPNPWVASEGSGVAAPVPPGAGVNEIVLRVRLFNLTTGYTYAQRQITLPIVNAPSADPRIRYFTTGATGIDATALAQRTARVPVSWAVDNRPLGTNLVFEQVLPGGTLFNVELPRDNPWVASEGVGIAAPMLPQGANVVVLRLRLVNLANSATLAYADLTIPITGSAAQSQPGAVSAQIASFTASPDPVARGGSLTLAWNTTGAARVSIDRLSEQAGAFVETIARDLLASGTFAYTIPQEYAASIPLTLVVEDTGGGRQTNTLTVRITCPYAQTLTGRCPTSQTQTGTVFETFERGSTIWRADTRQIYVLYQGGRYEQYADTWTEGEPVTYPETPPAGLFQPERGFGKLWVNNEHVRSGLGWATSTETGYSATLEIHPAAGGGENILMTLPDGRLLRLDAQGSWQYN